jgi:SnoaL-like domain
MHMTDQRAVYDRFAAAWAAKDVGGCLALMTEDAQYCASIGPEPGKTFSGQIELRAGISAMIAHDNAAAIEIVSWTELVSYAFVEWKYHYTDGSIALGIDRIDFRDGLISRKQAYRKVRDELGA